MRRRAIAYALLSAALFGASNALAKALLGEVSPLMLAGLLYLASGVGLARGAACAAAPVRGWAPATGRGSPPPSLAAGSPGRRC